MQHYRLNLACARWPAEEWINTDVRDYPHVDLTCDVRAMPFEDDLFSYVYCGHLLEHLPFDEVIIALQEIKRVMAPGAVLMICGPDIDRARELHPGDTALHDGIITGHAGWEEQDADPMDGDVHHWLSTADLTLTLVQEVFPDAVEVSDAAVVSEMCDGRPWPVVSYVDWEFFIRCVK